MNQVKTENRNTDIELSFRDDVKKYVNYFFAESGTMILLRIKQYLADPNMQKSILKNVFKDENIKDSLQRNLENLLEKHGYKEEYKSILWYAFSSNTNPDFDILLQRFMISVPQHACEFENKIDKEKWGLLEDKIQREIHDNSRLGIYARYRSGDIPRDKERIVLINANEGIGLKLKNDWRINVLNEEKSVFYLWLTDEIECKKALYTANLTIVEDDNRTKFYEYMKFIWNGIDKGENAMLLYTAKPIAYAPGGIPEHSIGEVYLAEYQKPLSKDARDIVIDYFENIALIFHAQFARYDMDVYLKNKILKEQIKSATQAAISQVMARNSSHNIGSHVLSNLTSMKFFNDFSFCEDCCKKNQGIECSNECSLSNYKGLEDIKFDKSIKDQKDKLLKLLSVFNDYIRTRMEYISDISFGEPVMATNKKLNGEIFKAFDENRLLLNFISGLNKFKYKLELTCNSNKINANNDIEIPMPNDVLGQQAFYNIIENFIRNTAKHNNKKIEGNIVKFTVNIKNIPDDNDYYQVEIFDDIDISSDISSLDNKDEEETTQILNYFGFENVTEINEIHKLVYRLNNKLNGSILDKGTNQLRDNSLGLMEMEASACYLRMMEVNNIESDDYALKDKSTDYNLNLKNGFGNYNILRAIIKDEKYLGYTFFLLKPNDYLFVGFEKKEIHGADFFTKEELMKDLTDNKKFRHQFIIFKTKEDKEFTFKLKDKEVTFAEYKHRLPYRWLTINNEEDCIYTKLKIINKIELDDCIWEKWWKKIKGDYSFINVFISFDPNDSDHKRDNRYNICFLNHDDGKGSQITNYNNGNINFLEALSSKGQQTLPDFTRKLSDYTTNNVLKGRITTHYKLFESAKATILILDERVQRIFENENYMEIAYKQLYAYSNIYVPFQKKISTADEKKYCTKYLQCDENWSDCSIDLGTENFDITNTNKLNAYIDKIKENTIDIIAIHFSILERMKLGEEDMKEFISKLQRKCKKVVITSGRGKPKEITTLKVGFINISSLLNAMHTVRSKYLLYQLLINSRN